MRDLIRRMDARFPGCVSLAIGVVLWATLTAGSFMVSLSEQRLMLLVLMAVVVAFCLLRFAYRQRHFWGPLLGFVLLLATSASLIGSFAEIYARDGIVGPDGNQVHADTDCLYFSIVTFTTLGYGDFRPTPECRLFAATEAILGYIYFGLTVAILFDLVQRRSIGSSSGSSR